MNFATSPPSGNDEWSVVVDTATGKVNGDGGPRIITAGEHFEVPALVIAAALTRTGLTMLTPGFSASACFITRSTTDRESTN